MFGQLVRGFVALSVAFALLLGTLGFAVVFVIIVISALLAVI